MKLLGRLVPVAEVTQLQREQMFALMTRYYENVRRDAFDADLAEKLWVIQLIDPSTRELCGFSTQTILEATVQGRPLQALFSGDTIIAQEHWGDQALAHVWGQLALSLIDALPPDRDLFWFLLSKGYKTYRFLPVFFHVFYPAPGEETSPRFKTIIDAFARHKYPHAYDAERGVVRAGPGKDRLRAGVADITSERLKDPLVRFFVQRNPQHEHGEELCCLAPLSRANFTAAAYRVIRAGAVVEPQVLG
jgi:hypothetical protein